MPIYDIPLTTLAGEQTTLAAYKGKVLLLVNVASKCGLTPQYTQLEQLYQQFKAQGLVICGFPANDFAGQEPGTDVEIQKFCSTEYPVSFPMFSKVVATGPEKHALYKELIAEQPERTLEDPKLREDLGRFAEKYGVPPPNNPPELLWNFEKFLIGRDGKIVARFNPSITPDDARLVQAVSDALQG